MTVSLDEQEDIRRMDRDGVPRAQIARELHLTHSCAYTNKKRRDRDGRRGGSAAGCMA